MVSSEYRRLKTKTEQAGGPRGQCTTMESAILQVERGEERTPCKDEPIR